MKPPVLRLEERDVLDERLDLPPPPPPSCWKLDPL
jgi:hypothetical protein